jgi:hypothetical protein
MRLDGWCEQYTDPRRNSGCSVRPLAFMPPGLIRGPQQMNGVYSSRNANPTIATANGIATNTHFVSVNKGPIRSENGDKTGQVPAILK